MSAQEEFILYDLRGWMVSFCTVSISSASSSWSNTWHLRAGASQHRPLVSKRGCASAGSRSHAHRLTDDGRSLSGRHPCAAETVPRVTMWEPLGHATSRSVHMKA